MAKSDEWAMPPIGWLAAAGVGFLAWQAWRNRGGAPEQQQVVQQAQIPTQGGNSMPLGGGLMGHDGNGIPIVALPSESAARSRSVKTAPSWAEISGQAGPKAGNNETKTAPAPHPYAGENFGGSGMAGSGESF